MGLPMTILTHSAVVRFFLSLRSVLVETHFVGAHKVVAGLARFDLK